MKLMNPSGRTVDTFNTEVYGCMCSKGGNHSGGVTSDTHCQCSHGPVNGSSNASFASHDVDN